MFPHLSCESEKMSGGHARRENSLVSGSQIANCGWVGSAFAKGRLAIAVINAFAEPVECSVSLQPREGLGDRRERKVAEILQSPQALAAPFDTLADQARDVAGTNGRFGNSRHTEIMGFSGGFMSSFSAIKLDI